jgi:integrase/recombinase XerD
MLAREVEEGGARKRVTIAHATAAFIRDTESRNLKESSIYKYRLLFRRLETFSVDRGLKYVTDLDLDTLRDFRGTWKLKNYARRVTNENLRALMRFCQDSGWIKSNPARLLRSPEITPSPSLPFTKEEYAAILAACDTYRTIKNGLPIKAFVLVLRWSGLRIRDVVTLRRDAVTKDRLFLYTAKTGTPVFVPLPPQCVEALNAIPVSGDYFFGSGSGSPKVRVGNFQAALKKLFTLANVTHGHAHRSRHLFAISLLQKGTPIERVSILLGHSSTKVTSQHYRSHVQASQEQVEKDVRATWG